MMHRLKQWYKDLFLYPRKTLGADEAYWSTRGRKQGASLSAWQKERADWALSRMDHSTSVTVLDVGSGDGGVLQYLKKHFPQFNGIGIDRDSRSRESLVSLGFTAHDLDLSDNIMFPECEYAFLFEILEHVSDAEGLLTRARVASRRGVFFSVPNTGFFTHRFRLFFGKFPAQWAERPNEHVRFWTLTDMHWWLRAQHITNAEICTYEGVPLLRWVFPSLFAAGIIVWIPHV